MPLLYKVTPFSAFPFYLIFNQVSFDVGALLAGLPLPVPSPDHEVKELEVPRAHGAPVARRKMAGKQSCTCIRLIFHISMMCLQSHDNSFENSKA